MGRLGDQRILFSLACLYYLVFPLMLYLYQCFDAVLVPEM
jgi:hypothetical protein